MQPEQLRFAKTHEWVGIEKTADGTDLAVIGVSAFALEALTDLVYIELPKVGRQLQAGETFGEIESVKAVSDLYAPVAGEVVAVNVGLAEKLEHLATAPYSAGWMVKLRPTNAADIAQLMDYASYQRQCAEEGH